MTDATSGICTMIETPQEESTVKREWGDMWSNSRCPGLSPENKSWLFKFCQDLLPNNVKLQKFKLEDSPNCPSCGQTDTRLHFLECPLSNGIGSVLVDVITASTSSKTQPSKEELSTLNFSLEPHLVLPAMTLLATAGDHLQTCRKKKKKADPKKVAAAAEKKADALDMSKKHKNAAHNLLQWSQRLRLLPSPAVQQLSNSCPSLCPSHSWRVQLCAEEGRK